jgi:hypothetical protein
MHHLLIWMQAHTARQEIMTVHHDDQAAENQGGPVSYITITTGAAWAC